MGWKWEKTIELLIELHSKQLRHKNSYQLNHLFRMCFQNAIPGHKHWKETQIWRKAQIFVLFMRFTGNLRKKRKTKILSISEPKINNRLLIWVQIYSITESTAMGKHYFLEWILVLIFKLMVSLVEIICISLFLLTIFSTNSCLQRCLNWNHMKYEILFQFFFFYI